MPYYNPLNNQTQDRYYSPYDNVRSSPSPAQALGETAKSFAVLAGLNLAGAVATRYLGNAGRSVMKGWLKRPTGLRRAVAQRAYKATRVIGREKSAIKQAFKRTGVGQAYTQRKTYLKSLSGKPGYNISRVTSAFKNPKTFLGTTMGVWKNNVLSGAAVAYGVDSMLGITRQMGLKKKAWYDVPGQVSNFGKWMVQDAIANFAMVGASRLMMAGGGLGMSAVSRAFGGNFGKKLLGSLAPNSPALPRGTKYESALGIYSSEINAGLKASLNSQEQKKFVSEGIKKGLHFGRTVRDSVRSINSAIRTVPDAIKEAWKAPEHKFSERTKKAFNTLNAALKNVKEIATRPREELPSSIKYHGLRAMEAFEKFADRDAHGGSLINPLKEHFIPEIKRINDKQSVLQRMFPFLQPLRNKDVVGQHWIDNIQGKLQGKYGAGEVETLMNNFLNMKVGNNIYRDWRGGKNTGAGVDLNAFDPIYQMRRAASFIANKRINIPFTRAGLSIADVTHVNSVLQDSPTFEFFDYKPNFYIDDPQYGKGSIGKLAGEKNPLYMYVNGKYAIFDGTGIHTVDSRRKLRYAARTSKDKSYELKNILMAKAKYGPEAQAAGGFNKIKDRVDYYDVPKNPFLGFLDRRGLGLPGKLGDILHIIEGKLEGKNNYKLIAGSIFGDEGADSLMENKRYLPLIENTYEHTSQVFSRVLQNKEAHNLIANFIDDSQLKKDFLAAAWSDRALMDQIDDLNLKADDWIHKTGFVRAVNNIKAYPKTARTHEVIAGVDNLTGMTSMDVARVNVIDDIFNRSFINETSKDQAHPLLAAVPRLIEQGIITPKEGKALKLHGQLSIFRNDGLTRNVPDSKFFDVVNSVRRRAKENNWNSLNDLMDFVSNTDMRRPSLRKSQEQILNEVLEINKDRYTGDMSPYFSAPKGIGVLQDIIGKTLDSTTDLLSEWLPYKKRYMSHHGIGGSARYIGGLIGTTAAIGGAYGLADTMVASNPLFDDTMLEGGLTGVGADVLAKTRFGVSTVADFTGVTKTMKYIHGLTPGMESFIPGAGVGGLASAVAGTGPLGILKWTVAGGLINRLASPFLPDLTKSKEELEEIYSGRQRVPIMKSPTWILGGTPWEGTKVQGYSPNWYVRAKSRWKETDTMYGSAFRKLIHEPLPLLGFNVGDIIDPYYMERKAHFSRPYPLTGKIFSEVPIVGGLLSDTIGRIIKPQKTMHQEFLTQDMIKAGAPGDPYPFAIKPPSLGEGLAGMQHTPRARTMGGQTMNGGMVMPTYNKKWSETAAEDFLYDVSHFAGLKGYLGKSVSERIFGEPSVMPTLETAGRISSMSRSYHDMNLGGLGVITEPIRRLIDKPDYRQYGINPIPNLMPNFLPQRFLTGDPYSSIIRGELRLPGEAYAKTKPNLKRDMPARSSMMGAPKEHMIQYFTGTLAPVLREEYDIMESGTDIHAAVQDHLAAEGLLVQAEALIYDVKNDISGHVDAIIKDGRGGGGRKALEIKSISQEGFEKLHAPKDSHLGQLNIYLKELGLKKGSIMYVMRENPSMVKTFEMNYSQDRWERDIKKLKEARHAAQSMMEKGVVDDYGYSYSWLDRLEILADVAPMSKEFSEAKFLVEKQIKFGVFTQDEITRYKTALKHRQARIRKYELYPRRFSGKVFSPDTEKNIQSINEDIKAAAEYSLPERAVGALYENFTNTNWFLTNKLFAFKDPLEHYQQTRLYNKEYKPWDEPIKSFVEPGYRNLRSKTNPLEGGLSFGTVGFIFGGPFGAVLGGAFGSSYGAMHGAYRNVTGSSYIPGSVEEKREIVSYFDAAKYAKADMLSQLTTGLTQKRFLDVKSATLSAFNQDENGSVANLFRATPFMEKPYIESFLNTRNPKERQEILKYVPEDLGSALKKQWSKHDESESTREFINNSSRELSENRLRRKFDRSVLDPSTRLEDIELRTIQEAGYDEHEFGLGWNEQMFRLSQEKNIRGTDIHEDKSTPMNLSSGHVRGILNSLFDREGIQSKSMVYINNNSDDYNVVNVTIRRDRSRSIINALDNRKRFNL